MICKQDLLTFWLGTSIFAEFGKEQVFQNVSNITKMTIERKS